MISAIAIDDEPLALLVIERYCAALDFIDLKKTFTRLSAATKYLEEHSVELLFLDINMPSISGTEFYQSVDPKVMAIFTTAHAEYALDGFRLSAIDYILKPIEQERFNEAARKAYEHYMLRKTAETVIDSFLVLKMDYGHRKVYYVDILLIKAVDNYLKIYLKDNSHLLIRMTLKAIEETLPSSQFIRVHRSYIVRIGSVDSVRNKVITIGNHVISLRPNYHDDFIKRFGGY